MQSCRPGRRRTACLRLPYRPNLYAIIRNEGLLYSAATVGYKIGSGLTASFIGFVLDAAGYNGLAATQTALAHTAISALFLLLPIVAWGVLAIVLWVYKLDREYADIMRDLQAGRYSPKTMLTNQNP